MAIDPYRLHRRRHRSRRPFPILKGVLRGLLYVVQFVLDLVYLVLVWWWLALIRKAQGEELPPLWPFGKKV